MPGASTTVKQDVPISIDVTFVDVSKTALPVEAAKPVFLARLPYDFFYPFYVDSGMSVFGQSMRLLPIFCMFVTFLFNL